MAQAILSGGPPNGPSRPVWRGLVGILLTGCVATAPHLSRSLFPAVTAPEDAVRTASSAAPVATASMDSQAPGELSARDARHLVGRFTFGVTQQDVAQTKALGVEGWLEIQLNPEAIEDAELELQLEEYQQLLLPPSELRKAYKRIVELPPVRLGEMPRTKKRVDDAKLLGDLQSALLVRQAFSNRQLLEVMVDFWFNHFNVYALKHPALYVVGDYIDRAIRPNALGRFEDLLIATARHAAMLMYLDNYKSNVRSRKAGIVQRITENYAREMLELQTVGVNEHTQRDVIEVARILTGWTIADLEKKDYDFAFKPNMHDFGAKTVLGVEYPAGQGEEEGITLLRRLARHPATARHIAAKLCVRFVAHEPSPACIERLSQVFLTKNGDLRAVLRSLVDSPEFWSGSARDSKLKSPHAFMVSALRALDVRLAPGGFVPRYSARLGQPILIQPVPTGYVEEPATRLSVSDVLERMNFATLLASKQIKGATFDSGALDNIQDDGLLVASVRDTVFAGAEHEATLDKIRRRVAAESRREFKVRVALAMALASPEFQYY